MRDQERSSPAFWANSALDRSGHSIAGQLDALLQPVSLLAWAEDMVVTTVPVADRILPLDHFLEQDAVEVIELAADRIEGVGVGSWEDFQEDYRPVLAEHPGPAAEHIWFICLDIDFHQVDREEGPGVWVGLEGKDLGRWRAGGGDYGIQTGERAHVEHAAAGLTASGKQVGERPLVAGPPPPPQRPRHRVL